MRARVDIHRPAESLTALQQAMLHCPAGVDPVGDYIASLARALKQRATVSVYAYEHRAILVQMRADEKRQTLANTRTQVGLLRAAVEHQKRRTMRKASRTARLDVATFVPGQRRSA